MEGARGWENVEVDEISKKGWLLLEMLEERQWLGS